MILDQGVWCIWDM